MNDTVQTSLGLNIAGCIFLLIILAGLAYSFVEQQKASGDKIEMPNLPKGAFLKTLVGACIGGIIGVILFWPSVMGHHFSIAELKDIYAYGGADYVGFIHPWIVKSLLCLGIGGACGFALNSFTAKSAH